jgi:hypothetical protein
MEHNLSSEDAAFRDEVRAFIAENYPAEMRVPNPETADAALARRRYGARSVPKRC